MNYYEISPNDGYELCHPINKSAFEFIIEQVNGCSRISSWEPMAFEIINRDRGKKLKASDSPWLDSHALVFNEKAKCALGDIIKHYGEFLDIDCGAATLSILNVLAIRDALSEKSNVVRFSNGNIMMIKKCILSLTNIKGADIFKLSGMRTSPVFVSDNFVERWKSSKLVGLNFNKIELC